MDFDFTDDQESLRDAVRRWVDKDYDFARRHAVVKAGGFSQEAWDGLVGLGLTGLLVSEEHGGLGFGPVDAMVVMEELGRGIVMEPYAQAGLIAPSVLRHASAEVQAAWLPKIAGGEAMIVLAHQERAARYDLSKCVTRYADGKVSGAKSLVPAGDKAGAFIVPATGQDGRIVLALVERGAAGVATRAYSLQDGSRAAEVSFTESPATLLVEDGLPVLELAVDLGIAALCAEGVGAMDTYVKLTAEYLNTRKQFGVPIASFQALRHRMADVKMQLELARSMSYFATLKLGEPAEARRYALAQAKLQLSNSARFVGQQCTQLHGGIGVTDEYVGSHYFKRLTAMEMQFGDGLHQLGIVSAGMQETAGVFA
ncbi:acyl-CoA dehydrogenase family protein [Pelomonas sp. KK5]|uniref:acyl-CoA dehydrogenase family protein n=1 Tax=Pelomonas sp. KK5 TaxID=1855730 RepID=UPI00097C59E4|nr:acyl-CoA dehydrogenase family protein [Pelomonas sp. KK5]